MEAVWPLAAQPSGIHPVHSRLATQQMLGCALQDERLWADWLWLLPCFLLLPRK